MNDKEWYVAVNGQQQGPFTVDALRQQASRTPFPPDTLVWSDGMAEWLPIAATPLADLLFRAAPAAAPSAASARRPSMTMNPADAGEAAPANVGFVDAIKIGLSKYVDFTGRASRPEFWWFILFGLIVSILTGWIDFVGALISLALLLPNIAVGVRRLHDTDRSGWWYLLILVPLIGVIVLIVFFCQKGTPGRNRFG